MQSDEMDNAAEISSEKFENGIMAGDLNSLLEMFEEAETVLSSSVGCICLTQTGSVTNSERDMEHGDETCLSSGHPVETYPAVTLPETMQSVATEDAKNFEIGIVQDNHSLALQGNFDNVTTRQRPLDYAHSELASDGSCAAVSCSMDHVPRQSVTGMTHELSCDQSVKDDALGSGSKNAWDDSVTKLKSSELLTDTVNFGLSSLMSDDRESDDSAQMLASEISTDAIPCSSLYKPSSCRDDSESSSEWDDAHEDKWSDSSSSPTSNTPYNRGRGSTARRDGPCRRQGRGAVKPVDEEKLYDRLPSYYTMFSRPNRTATGLVRNSRSCLKLVLNSDLPTEGPDLSPKDSDQIFDKVPAYQSCFTNSTRYDEEMGRCANFDSERVFGQEEDLQRGRGHGSGSSYSCSRLRYRSRSRLRTVTSPRNRHSGRTANHNINSSATSEKTTNKELRNSTVVNQGSVPDSQVPKSELDENKPKQQRRIVYIGRIPVTMTSERLKDIFQQFGEIERCTAHFRECGDNYGFVTYGHADDACKAVERGNQLPVCENFDICFGGRRNFCRADYFDLDGNVEIEEELAPVILKLKPKNDFDDLLMDTLLKRKLQ